MTRNSQPLSGEYILLGALLQKPMHGYDLYKYLNTDPVINQIWTVKQSMMYAMLEKLESLGLVESKIVDSGTLPVKREYHVSGVGENAFMDWMTTPVERPREIRVEFLAKLSFLLQADREQARILLERQRNICNQWLEIHQQHSAESEDDPTLKVVLDYKQSQMESILTWIDYCLQGISV